ncbi:hypothetical protein BC830DRAFT_1142895 [Chytriomyces sp. MP71]|nr:hypothetical protein BC830DRAFT_1142895 [Chytriomyces sp. MP71]
MIAAIARVAYLFAPDMNPINIPHHVRRLRHPLTMNEVPNELIVLALSWIHPYMVFKFRRLSHRFHQCLSHSSFARVNLSRFDLSRELMSTWTVWMLHWPSEWRVAYARLHGSSCRTVVLADRKNLKPAIRRRFPEEVHLLCNLQYLDLSRCHLQGVILENAFCQLENLKQLDLSMNGLNGCIPRNIGNLKKLVYLNLNCNALQGDIPESMWTLPTLVHLCLAQNNLSGGLSENVGNLKHIKRLVLHHNNLSGRLPETVGRLRTLLSLEIGHNHFAGSLPESIGDLTNLSDLDISFNRISGQLPTSFWRLQRLGTLLMRGNDFQGLEPESLSRFPGLQEVDISQVLEVNSDVLLIH